MKRVPPFIVNLLLVPVLAIGALPFEWLHVASANRGLAQRVTIATTARDQKPLRPLPVHRTHDASMCVICATLHAPSMHGHTAAVSLAPTVLAGAAPGFGKHLILHVFGAVAQCRGPPAQTASDL